MEEIVKELEKIRGAIQDSKTKKAQLEGRKQEQMNRLKEFGVKSIEEGNTKLAKMVKELGKLETEIQSKFATLKETYEW